MRRSVGPWTLAEVVTVLVVVALVLSVAANVTTSIQAYSNCKKIELLRAQTRLVLTEQYDNLISGRLDADYKKFYGEPDWLNRKTQDLATSIVRIHRFDPEKCHLFIH